MEFSPLDCQGIPFQALLVAARNREAEQEKFLHSEFYGLMRNRGIILGIIAVIDVKNVLKDCCGSIGEYHLVWRSGKATGLRK